MKTSQTIIRIAPTALLVSSLTFAWAQGTAFTYQGWLTVAGTPFTGTAEFQATLWDAENGGIQVATNIPATASVGVSNGLFVLPLDFGASFPGGHRWLQLAVRTALVNFTPLTPRQRLTATPYAQTASNLTGALPATQLSGTLPSERLRGTYSSAVTFENGGNRFSGDGSELTSLNADNLTTGTVPDKRLGANVARTSQVWLLGGNDGTTPGTHFLGTTDDQALEFKVNGLRAARLEFAGDSIEDGGLSPDGAPNVILGAPVNFVAAGAVGATIAGGGATNFNSQARSNAVLASFGVIGGGLVNRIEAQATTATIAGGYWNEISTNSDYGAIGGGWVNQIADRSSSATIAGGEGNTIGTHSDHGVVAGGQNNSIAAEAGHATVAGGLDNTVGTNADFSGISGGQNNTIAENSIGAVVAGGVLNTIGTNASCSTIGGGTNNTIAPGSTRATIAGGRGNEISTNSFCSVISGGYGNSVANNAEYATVAGGFANSLGGNSDGATIAGGYNNEIAPGSPRATVPGGTAALASNYGQMAYASGCFTTRGDAQTSVYIVRGTTTNELPTELFLDGFSRRIQVPAESTWTFDVLVAARTTGGASAGYQIQGVIVHNGTITSLRVSNRTVLSENDDSWNASVVANNTYDALEVRVWGATNATVRWVATVRTAEVRY